MTNRERASELMDRISRITGTYKSEQSIREIELALDAAEQWGRECERTRCCEIVRQECVCSGHNLAKRLSNGFES